MRASGRSASGRSRRRRPRHRPRRRTRRSCPGRAARGGRHPGDAVRAISRRRPGPALARRGRATRRRNERNLTTCLANAVSGSPPGSGCGAWRAAACRPTARLRSPAVPRVVRNALGGLGTGDCAPSGDRGMDFGEGLERVGSREPKLGCDVEEHVDPCLGVVEVDGRVEEALAGAGVGVEVERGRQRPPGGAGPQEAAPIVSSIGSAEALRFSGALLTILADGGQSGGRPGTSSPRTMRASTSSTARSPSGQAIAINRCAEPHQGPWCRSRGAHRTPSESRHRRRDSSPSTLPLGTRRSTVPAAIPHPNGRSRRRARQTSRGYEHPDSSTASSSSDRRRATASTPGSGSTAAARTHLRFAEGPTSRA
jgi:hypothetical protein